MSINSTNPSTYFGGTWERLWGRYLYGNEPPNDSLLGEGFGSVSFDTEGHILTQQEMPNTVAVNRVAQAGEWSLGAWGSNNPNQVAWTSCLPGQYGMGGQNEPHTHKFYPPSTRVAIWVRIA